MKSCIDLLHQCVNNEIILAAATKDGVETVTYYDDSRLPHPSAHFGFIFRMKAPWDRFGGCAEESSSPSDVIEEGFL